MEGLTFRITVSNDRGQCRTFDDEQAAAVFAAELTLKGTRVLTTITFSDGDAMEIVAVPLDQRE